MKSNVFIGIASTVLIKYLAVEGEICSSPVIKETFNFPTLSTTFS